MNILDCHFRSENLIAKELSNLYPHPFVIDDIRCGSMEGWIQSLKFSDPEEQAAVAALSGYEAYKTGQYGSGWKETQTLHWLGKEYPRLSRSYRDLMTRAYDECFDQNEGLIAALIETGNAVLVHYIGKHDPATTTLTETEYVYHLYRLRARAFQIIGEE